MVPPGTPSIPQDDNSLLLLEQMEEEYIQFTDDASPHVSSPVKSRTGRNNQVEASEQTAQVVSLAVIHSSLLVKLLLADFC